MKYSDFGPTGITVPIIGQGTWNLEKAHRPTAVYVIQQGIALGLAHIDTAEMYGHGQVESLLGEAIKGRREEIFLVSKVLPSNASRRGTLKACEQSLTRLKTEYLDCYLLHWPGSHPLSETIEAFEELVVAGKIRSWGVSNFDEHELAQVISIAGEGHIACNQVLYHLNERTIEHAIIPYCEQHKIAVVGYTPFGSGPFPSATSKSGRILKAIAIRHRATPRQIALAFLNRQRPLFAIPKAAKLAHIEENAAAGDVVLTVEDIKQIDTAFPRGRRRRGVATL